MCKTIGIVSLKGGVGKTSVVSSLGSALAGMGKRVLLIDGNLSAPNLGIHFNVVEPKATLHDVLNGDVRVKEAIHNVGEFDLIPSSLFNPKLTSPLKLKDKIKPLKRHYDVIIIDSSPALNEETLAAMLASDSLLVATTPDYSTLSTTLKAVKLANQRGTQIDGLILNKVHGKNFELNSKDVENTLDIPVLAVVPFDTDVLKAQSKFVPYVKHSPNSSGSVEFKKLASTLMGEKYRPSGFKHYFKRMVPKREEINRTIYYNSLFK